MAKTLKDFETKKTIHFNVTRESHSKLRITCFKNRVSMQEVFEEVCQKIAAESPDMISLIEDVATKKRNKIIKKLSETDAESVFNIIEQENPLNGE
tara:strand:- start:289 stop:576 length:288 start_codon:yes stop_codon:yes gene_type:complete